MMNSTLVPLLAASAGRGLATEAAMSAAATIVHKNGTRIPYSLTGTLQERYWRTPRHRVPRLSQFYACPERTTSAHHLIIAGTWTTGAASRKRARDRMA